MLQVQFGINIALGIFVAICASVTLGLGKGIQRIGADTLGKGILKKWREDPAERRKIITWIVGSAMTGISAVLQVVAMFFLDRPSTYVALSGTGILAVVLFSAKVLKESISKLQVAGIASIIIGTTFIGIDYPEIAEKTQPGLGFMLYAIAFGSAGVIIAILTIKRAKGFGIVFGSIAGFFNGFAAISTAFATATGDNELIASVINPYLVASLLLGQGAFWSTQFAFKKGGNASVTVPAENSFVILIPVVLDAFVHGIPFGPFQVLAITLNVAGILVLSIASARILDRVMTAPVKTVEKDSPEDVHGAVTIG